jgi:hypothetical protein
MDPLMQMFLASQMQQPAAGADPFANPEMVNNLASVTPEAGAAAPANGGLASILGALKGSEGPKPQFSGGVSGAGLPFRTSITDMLTPAIAQIQAQQNQRSNLPTLGALFAQAPGGGA